MNTGKLLAEQERYFSASFDEFKKFGGPCVYFHQQCIKASRDSFLSERHLEMLYATLTSWGMHRMGDDSKTKAKLTEWSCFRDSILMHEEQLVSFRQFDMLLLSEAEYFDALKSLKPCYDSLKLTISKSTIVVNSKALHHLLPLLIPPIDRQYTVRFFTRQQEEWRDKKGKFKQILLPGDRKSQFDLFQSLCLKTKQLADRVLPSIFVDQERLHGVTAPKAVDNAIVKFVRDTQSHSVLPNNV